MINVRVGRDAYSMSFIRQTRVFGPYDIRECIECTICYYEHGTALELATGFAVCHPSDEFDLLKGMRIALNSAAKYLDRPARKAFYQELESWFHNEQDI